MRGRFSFLFVFFLGPLGIITGQRSDRFKGIQNFFRSLESVFCDRLGCLGFGMRGGSSGGGFACFELRLTSLSPGRFLAFFLRLHFVLARPNMDQKFE